MSEIKISEDQKWAFFFLALIFGCETGLFSSQRPKWSICRIKTPPSSSSFLLLSRFTPFLFLIRKQTSFYGRIIKYSPIRETKNKPIRIGQNKQKKKIPRKGTRNRQRCTCSHAQESHKNVKLKRHIKEL